jgi:hypothetical protein
MKFKSNDELWHRKNNQIKTAVCTRNLFESICIISTKCVLGYRHLASKFSYKRLQFCELSKLNN